jgi:hypothetical protein
MPGLISADEAARPRGERGRVRHDGGHYNNIGYN